MATSELPPAHLDVLINAGIQFGLTSKREAFHVGAILRRENLRSVNIQYPGCGVDAPPYTPRIVPDQFRGVSVLAAIHHYQQHTRRSLTWGASPARAWIARLRRAILTTLPHEDKQDVHTASGPMISYKTSPGYLAVPDAITSLDQITINEPSRHDDNDAPDKGFPVYILTGPHDCSNGGISSWTKRATILTIDGLLPAKARLSAATDDAPAVYLRFEYGRHVARPTKPSGVHYMASGAFLHSSDARWEELVGHTLPIPLHDRTER